MILVIGIDSYRCYIQIVIGKSGFDILLIDGPVVIIVQNLDDAWSL